MVGKFIQRESHIGSLVSHRQLWAPVKNCMDPKRTLSAQKILRDNG